jgi:protein arginine kinase activator
MLICEICKKKPATVHLTDIHNGEKKELHICQGCAEAQGITLQHSLSLQDLLSGISKKVTKGPTTDPECQTCGLKFSEFQSRGRLGCAQDYTAFREELLPMLNRIHGNVQHMGKAPGVAAHSGAQQQLLALQKQMREAVEREAYEEAAALRDQISSLKETLEAERNA